MVDGPRKLLLITNLCPGDVCTLTIAVDAIHRTYQNQFQTDVETIVPDIWQNNPYITKLDKLDPEVEHIMMHYPQIQRSNQTPINFISCYTEFLGEAIGKPLHAMSNKPLIYLSDEEKAWSDMLQDHWTNGRKVKFGVMMAGSKCDYTIKQWPVEYYQEVINKTLGLIQWVQVGAIEPNHNHIRLENCISLLGQTDHRQLHRLVYNSSIGLGPVTYLMHLCAAFDKPYVYIAGGREPVTWVNYPKMHTLHTIGALPCCRDNACWKSRVMPIGDGNQKDNELCENPVIGPKIPTALCMNMIMPEEVVRVIERTLRGMR